MAITRLNNSGIATGGVLKYDSAAAGYPPVMAAPTAADGGTGTTATVSFTAVSGATTYTALSSPGSFTASGASSPLTVSGLTAGTAYTFQVRANNSVGSGPYSAASNSVTPVVPGSFDFIAKASGPTSQITFNNIPQTYSHLELRWTGNSAQSAEDKLRIQCNVNPGSGSHENTYIGNSVGTGRDSGTLWNLPYTLGGTDNGYTHGFLDIYDYTSTNQRTGYGIAAYAQGTGTSSRRVTSYGVQFTPSTAITTLIIYTDSGANLASNFNIALYGIKDS